MASFCKIVSTTKCTRIWVTWKSVSILLSWQYHVTSLGSPIKSTYVWSNCWISVVCFVRRLNDQIVFCFSATLLKTSTCAMFFSALRAAYLNLQELNQCQLWLSITNTVGLTNWGNFLFFLQAVQKKVPNNLRGKQVCFNRDVLTIILHIAWLPI